jgi:5,10-methylenetetrahydromethanopterin reductase
VQFSIRLNNDLPVERYVTLARMAEEAGFDQFWVSDDLFLRSAWIILSAVIQATDHIEVGTCIVNPYTMHPAEMAMAAATLDELSGGRFNLGLSAGAADFLRWIGIEQERPLAAVKETTQVIRRLLSGERVDFDGQFLGHWTPEAYMRFDTHPLPIYIGAMGPNMLRAIGQIADGGLPLLLPPEHYETVIKYIREGAAAEGRSMEEVDVAACVWCSISSDRQAAEKVLKDKIAYYGHALGPLILERLGLTRHDFTPIEAAIMRERDPAKARSLVTSQMLRIGIVGTAKDIIDRAQKLVEMGVRHLSFGPPLGPDLEQAIKVLGRDVVPYLAEG